MGPQSEVHLRKVWSGGGRVGEKKARARTIHIEQRGGLGNSECEVLSSVGRWRALKGAALSSHSDIFLARLCLLQLPLPRV